MISARSNKRMENDFIPVLKTASARDMQFGTQFKYYILVLNEKNNL